MCATAVQLVCGTAQRMGTLHEIPVLGFKHYLCWLHKIPEGLAISIDALP